MRKIKEFSIARMVGFMAMMAMLLTGSMSAKAADVDLGEITIGQEYPFDAFKLVEGHFTAPSTGELTVNGINSADLFTDAAMTKPVEAKSRPFFPVICTFDVEQGKTYYIQFKGWDAGTLKLTMAGIGEDALEMLVCDPAENTYYDLASEANAQLFLQFNLSMSVNSEWKLRYENTEGTSSTDTFTGATATGNSVMVPLQQQLLRLINSGKMKTNSGFEVMLSDLRTASGQQLESHLTNGYTVFRYKVGNLPAKKVSETVPSEFLSYWLPGNEAAKLEVVFDSELGRVASTGVLLQYGNPEGEDGSYYVESVPFEIDGKVLRADFSGVLRTPATMLPLTGLSMPTITIRLQSIVDKNGSPVYTGTAGTVGSFDYMRPYTLLKKANVTSEFTPATGASIATRNNIKVWMSGLETVSFTGFRFTYPGDSGELSSVVVPVAQATFDADSDDEGEYTVIIPAECKGKKGVRVTLDGVTAADGYDHSDDVMALYDSFALRFCNPKNGEQLDGLFQDDVITIESPYASTYPGMYVIYEVEDLNPAEGDDAIIKTEAWMNRQADGSYTADIFGNYKMILGHRYRVYFTAWATESDKNYGGESLGTDYVTWEGSSLPFKYSPVQFVSITPDTDTKLTTADNVFVIRFDGYVNLDASTTFINTGQGSRMDFESIEPTNPQVSDDNVAYSDEWTLTVPASYLATVQGSVDLSVKAKDQDDLLVMGTDGKEENTFFYFQYDCASRYADVSASLSEDEELNEAGEVSVIWISNEIGIMPSYMMRENTAYVMTKSRDKVAEVASLIVPINDLPFEETQDMVNTKIGLVLDKKIEDAGAYVLYVPENYFNVGTEFNQYNSNEVYWSFSIAGEQSGELPHNMDISPVPGNVESLSTVTIVFTDEDEINVGSGMVKLHKDGVHHSSHDAIPDFDQWNKATIEFDTPHTAYGNYRLEFPEGYFVLGADGNRTSQAFNIEYNIGATGIGSITVTGAEGEAIYDLQGVKRNAEDLPAGIYIRGGRKVVVK